MFDDVLLNTTELFRNLLDRIDILDTLPHAYLKYLQFAPLFILGLIIAILVTPLVGHLAGKLNIFDLPAPQREGSKMLNKHDDPNRHIHNEAKPFLGGLAVIIPLIILMILFLNPSPTTVPIIIGLLILTISGILDDKYNLPPSFQLISQLLAALIVVFSAIDVTFINNPFNGYFHLEWFRYATTFLQIPISLVFPGDLLIIPWIILCINALKWVGGSDGLIETNSLIAFILLFVIGVRNTSAVIASISIITSGLILGSLYYNFPPAKIFTGSTGKTSYGFLIAVLALVNGAKVATTIIILALPIIDAFFTLVVRYIKYKPKNPLELLRINDKSHLHHQLLDLGLNSKQILLVESTIALLVGSLAIFTTGANKLVALISVLALIALILSIIRIRSAQKKNKKPMATEEHSPESKYTY